MRRYHVKTRQDYQDLMKHLEEEGILWFKGERPSIFDCWSIYEEETVITVYDNSYLKLGELCMYNAGDVIEYVACVDKENVQPSYYHNGSIDVIKFGEENFNQDELKGFYRMNVLEYVTHFDKKNGMEDLDKAMLYLNKLKEITEENE